MLRKFGNSFFRIQHAQIRLNDISEHFYQKMHSHVAFCVIYTRLLGKISLVVVSKDHFNTIVYYGGSGKVRGSVVALYLADGHYHTVTRLPTFLEVGYVCPDCFGSSVAARHHRCRYTCKFCTGSGKCQLEGDGQLCQDCKVVYPYGSCASRHVLTGVCGDRRTCSDCGKWYITKLASGAPGQHRCGHS